MTGATLEDVARSRDGERVNAPRLAVGARVNALRLAAAARR
jgi:hypothetical protein